MTCSRRLFNDPTGLLCDRTDDHTTGHRYHAAWTADRRDNYEPERDFR